MAKLAKYEEVVAVKDRIIWELTQGRKQVEEKLAEEKVIIDGKRGDCACACLDVWMFGLRADIRLESLLACLYTCFFTATILVPVLVPEIFSASIEI